MAETDAGGLRRGDPAGTALGLRAGFLLLEAEKGTPGAEDAEALRLDARRLLECALALDPMARLELGPILRRALDPTAG